MRKVITLKESDFFELSRDFLNKDVSIRFQAKGWSMRPYIQDGDIVTVSPLDDTSVKRGDVVFYSTAENKVIVHRVIKKYKRDSKTAFLIKGDATFGFPESINVQNVLGKVMEIERNGRKRRLDSRLYQMLNLFLAAIFSFNHWIYPIGSQVKKIGRKILGGLLEELQSPKLYRVLAKKVVKKNIHYQIASPEDAVSLYRLYNPDKLPGIESRIHVFVEQLVSPAQSDYWIIAKRENKVLGGANLSEFPEGDDPYTGWWISGMKVNWRYRRTGIGKILLKMAEEVAAREKASEIKLLVFKDARPANNLYRKMGFRPVSIPELDKQLEEEAKKTLRRRMILAKDIRSG